MRCAHYDYFHNALTANISNHAEFYLQGIKQKWPAG